MSTIPPPQFPMSLELPFALSKVQLPPFILRQAQDERKRSHAPYPTRNHGRNRLIKQGKRQGITNHKGAAVSEISPSPFALSLSKGRRIEG